jgi:soluble lytic murein transglycosylase-like protein
MTVACCPPPSRSGQPATTERNDMTALRVLKEVRASVAVFVRDVGNGLLEVSHNTLALLGLAVVAVLVFAAGRAELRQQFEQATFSWLQARHEARAERDGNVLAALGDVDAVARATATDPSGLTRPQAAVAQWLSRRYRVAPEPVSRLVQEAWQVGQRAGLDPTLILAIMAVESSFNPFAQSSVGAQGLMQVMTRVHDEKYEAFGGTHAAFDPVTNLRVGVQVLKECIARAGSLEAGLRYYVGAANHADDGGYASKVLAEQANLRLVVGGRAVSPNTPLPAPVPVPAHPPLTATIDEPTPVPAPEPAAAAQVAQVGQAALLR